MSDLRKKRIRFDEKKDVSQHHNNKTDAIELQSKVVENELFKEIFIKFQGGDQESKEAQKESKLMNKIQKKIRVSCPDFKIMKMGKNGEPVREESSDISKELFYSERSSKNNQPSYYCKDIDLLKAVYKEKKSFPKIKEFLQKSGCKTIPDVTTMSQLLRKSFISKEKYELWKYNAKYKTDYTSLEFLQERFKNKSVKKLFDRLRIIVSLSKYSEIAESKKISFRQLRDILNYRVEKAVKNTNYKIFRPTLERFKRLINRELTFENKDFALDAVNKYLRNDSFNSKNLMEALQNAFSAEFNKYNLFISDEDLKRELKINVRRYINLENKVTKNVIDRIKKYIDMNLKGTHKDNAMYALCIFLKNKERNLEKIFENIKSLTENTFQNNLFNKDLLRMYREYCNWVNKRYIINKANHNFRIHNNFIDFIKKRRDLSDNDRKKILKIIYKINREKLIKKYVLYLIHNTLYSAPRIARMEQIEGISLRYERVWELMKEYGRIYGLDSRKYTKAILKDIDESNPIPLIKVYEKYKEFGASKGLVQRLAMKKLGREKYHIIYPAPERIPLEKKEHIILDIKTIDSSNIGEIAKKNKVKYGVVIRIAHNTLSQTEFNIRFPREIPIEQGILVHNLIKKLATDIFDERRKYNKDIPKIYSETPIYLKSQKRTDFLFPNTRDYLIQILNKNSLLERLNLKLTELSSIDSIQFDTTNNLDDRTILSKIEKYQHPNTLLFILGAKSRDFLNADLKKIPDDKIVKYPSKIRIISPCIFISLLDLQGIYKSRFEEIIQLNDLNDIDTLRDLDNSYEYDLHDSKEMKKDLGDSLILKNLGPIDRFL